MAQLVPHQLAKNCPNMSALDDGIRTRDRRDHNPAQGCVWGVIWLYSVV
jgi:hypothetical protein